MVYYLQYQKPYELMPGNKALDGDINAVSLVDQTPEPGLVITSGPRALKLGRPIDPASLPTRIQITGGRPAVTDYDGYSGIVYVSPSMKSLVEELEPAVHQFFPVHLVDTQGELLADHWVWVVCNRIDSVDRNHTTMILWRDVLWRFPSDLPDEELPPGYDRSQPPRTVFSAAQTQGVHFWRDKFLLPGGLYCSDAAAAAIQTAGLTGIKLKKAETV